MLCLIFVYYNDAFAVATVVTYLIILCC